MSIYTSEKVLPYVYMCINKETNQFYIGYRVANKTPSHLDLPIYKTSSKLVRMYFDKFDWVILAEFFCGNDAYNFEQNLIRENWNNDKLLNLSVSGKIRPNNTGKIGVKDSNNNRFQVSNKDPRYLSGALQAISKDISRSQEFKNKVSKANKNKVTMFDATLNKNIKVSVFDNRIDSGELTPMNMGSKRNDETKLLQSISSGFRNRILVCRISDRKVMDIGNFQNYLNDTYSKRELPPKKYCCRIFDKKVMTVNSFTQWINREAKIQS